jgi:hypothetical protein
MRTRSRPRARSASSEEEDFDLGRIGVNRMLEYLVDVGALPATDPSGSGVLPQQPVDPGSQVSVATIEALFQRLLAQTAPVAQPAPQPTAPAAPTSTPTATGKPSLKFPDPPLFEGDPVKLDGWLTQTQMYLRAYDVDLSTVRAVDVATMFLRGKAQDWWTGQFHLQESGTVPILASWSAFVQALTAAFLPVELARRYIDQLLHVSQGKQDMRSYIAVFNSLRAKVPTAFPEETLSYLFLQGCRPDLQRNITLQYPKTLAEYFQHAITLSDLPNSHRPQPNVNKPPADSKPKTTSPLVCTHCGKPGHTEDRCFQLHPELRRRRLKASKP